MPTYRAIDLTDASIRAMADLIDSGAPQSERLKLELLSLSGRYSHIMATGGLTPRRESTALGSIQKAIERYLNANTDEKLATAHKKLALLRDEYISTYGEHRTWLNRAINELLSKNNLNPEVIDRLSSNIALLGSQTKGNLAYSYLIEELLNIYENLSSLEAITYRSDWYVKTKNYQQALSFLKMSLPLFLGQNNTPDPKTLEKQLTRYHPRLKQRPAPIIR